MPAICFTLSKVWWQAARFGRWRLSGGAILQVGREGQRVAKGYKDNGSCWWKPLTKWEGSAVVSKWQGNYCCWYCYPWCPTTFPMISPGWFGIGGSDFKELGGGYLRWIFSTYIIMLGALGTCPIHGMKAAAAAAGMGLQQQQKKPTNFSVTKPSKW